MASDLEVQAHPFAQREQQDLLTLLWRALDRRESRRFRRKRSDGSYVEWVGRPLNGTGSEASPDVYEMNERGIYWIDSLESAWESGVEFWDDDPPGDWDCPSRRSNP